jgi:dihydrofolate synthase/folylpolyglutamate synthase
MEQVLPGVFLDGAHNEDGIRQFMRTLRRLSKEHPAALLFSAVKEKDHERMVRELCTGVTYSFIVVTQVPGSRMMGAEALAELFRPLTDSPVLARPDIGEALETALRRKGESVLFCAGSLYLIGELKRRISLLKENGSISEGAE